MSLIPGKCVVLLVISVFFPLMVCSTAVLLNIDEISQFGDASRELFVKSGCYSVISVTTDKHSHTVSWVFSSEPKSICFSVVYKESMDTPVDQAKVPLTYINAHLMIHAVFSNNGLNDQPEQGTDS